ncbi:MAG: type II toxin-antitoxin system RelE/ParE family toxin [Verrucomicrobiota bacterium]
MSWDYSFDRRALRELRQMGGDMSSRIIRYLDERIKGQDDPRKFGKPLRHDLIGLWVYRVGNARVVCSIKDEEVLVLVVRVGFRGDVYD